MATATIAALCLAPTAQAFAADDDPAKPAQDRQSDVQAKERNALKRVSVKEQKKLIAQAKRGEDAMHRKLGLPQAEGLAARDVVRSSDGAKHVRYDRTYRGLRVIGGDLVVHTDKAGAVAEVTRASSGKLGVASLKPTTPKVAAMRKAHNKADYKVKDQSAELVVFATDGGDRLAWDSVVEGVKDDQTPSRLHVVVDAHNGKVLASWDDIRTGHGESIYSGGVEITTTATGGGYEMVDGQRGGGYTVDMNNQQSGGSVMTDADDNWGNGTMSDPHSAGVDAHYGAAETWDYFQENHGRNGIFDDGQGVPSRVHYGNAYVNAFWDGQQMTYGDGYNNQNPLTELDVAAHEMSHGVTEATAGLVYYGDAGGLNESTSDIFGAAVEFAANNSEDVGDYLIGEEIDINGDGTPLRYMDKPSRDGRSYDCWTSSMGNDDPHYTSGPGNHFFYLASEGSGSKVINGVSYNSPTCDGSTVEGIGRDKVAQVWYTALDTYMTSTTTYPEARDATVRAATDIYGADSAECTGIEAAWDAIDVPENDYACGGDGGGEDPTDPPVGECPDLQGVDSGTLGYSGDYSYEPGSAGYYQTTTSGTHSACLEGPAGTDFDLYLEKWNGSRWVRVASSLSASSHEEITYNGTAGAYSYVVQSYSGSGSYQFRFGRP